MKTFLMFFYILDQCYQCCHENDLGGFLGTISPEIWQDGRPMDKSVLNDWQKKNNIETLNEKNIVDVTYHFLELYERQYGYDFRKTKDILLHSASETIVKDAVRYAEEMCQKYKYTILKIENNDLRENEKEWIEAMLSPLIPYKQKIIDQINCAQISREYTDFYLSLMFKVERSAQQVICNTRVPVEMIVYKQGMIPVQFLMHVIDGYIVELEIFNADSSKIAPNLTFDDATIKVNFE